MTNIAAETGEKFALQLDEFYLDLQEDGRNIRVLSQAEIAVMPFPGLRPFKTSEFQLFKGRCGQADELLKRLKPARFLAVIGSSGTGKSSLVRAGLIPELFGADFHETGSSWNIAVCRPGKNPVANLAVALASIKAQSKNSTSIAEHYPAIETLLNQSIYGLLEANNVLNTDSPKGGHANLLVIVDQFEEVFRYDRKDLGRQNIENHFVDLLLKAAANQKGSVYVIITMRSEFLGDCVKYRGLPEAINKGQYLVPGLSRNEMKDVIEGPVHLTGKKISPGLVELLINEIDEARVKENLDQLPILQHALMRTYQEACRQGADEITYEHYKQVGEMSKALANHADAIFQSLKDESKDGIWSRKQIIAKLVFQTLTDASTDLKGGRRPTNLKAIYSVAAAIGATPANVNEVIEKFRGNDTSFLMPPVSTPLHEELIMDISHESLMRNWDLLKSWVEEETRYGKLYQKLNERREEDGQLIQGPLLAELINWRYAYPVNAAWASRYHSLAKGPGGPLPYDDLYTLNLRFLERSEQAAEEAKESEKSRFKEEARRLREEEMQQQKESGRKRMMRVLTAAVLVAIALSTWAFFSRNTAIKKEREARTAMSEARISRNRADSLLQVVEKKSGLIERSRDSVRKERDTAKLLAASLKKRTKELETANHFAEAETKRANQLQQLAERQKVVLEKQLVKIDVQRKELFYISALLDENMKDKILNSLFKEPLTVAPEIEPSRHLDTGALGAINLAVSINDGLLQEPISSLRKANKLWKDRTTRHGYADSILFEIFTKNNFPGQKIEPELYQTAASADPPTLLATTNGERFALTGSSQTITGSFLVRNLALNEVTWPEAVGGKLDSSGNASAGAGAGTSVINTLAFTGDTLLALKNDSSVMMHQGQTSRLLAVLPENGTPWFSGFSPDGRYLVTLGSDDVLKRWELSKAGNTRKMDFDTISSGSRNKSVSQLFFSPDGQNLVTLFTDNRFDVWNMNDLKRSTKFLRNNYAHAVAFTPDSKFLLAAATARLINVYDLAGQRVATINLGSSVRDETYTTSPITQLALSANWQTLLVNHGNSLLLYSLTERKYSPTRLGSEDRLTMKATRLFSFGEDVRNAYLLNENKVVALTYNGSVYQWNTRTRFTSLGEAFKNLRPLTDSTSEEKEQADPLAFEKLMATADAEQIREAGSFYFKKATAFDYRNNAERDQRIAKATRLFSKLAETDRGFYKTVDSGKLQVLTKLTEDNLLAAGDTLASIRSLRERIAEDEALLQKGVVLDSAKRNDLSLAYWDLSWQLVFQRQYDSVILSAKRSIELNKDNDGVMTNLALGYLLSGQFNEAEAIYRKYKDSTYANEKDKIFKESFLGDFTDLEKAGILSPANPAVYKRMEYIRRDILGKN